MSNQTTTKEKAQEPEKQPEQPQLSQELQVIAVEIKGLISSSALAKIKIGELLIQHKKTIKHGNTEAFYNSIGMADRTAQYYVEIASNEEVQKLKSKGKLDGLNMSKILRLAGMRVNVIGANSDNPSQSQNYVAKGLGSFEPDKCRSTTMFNKEYKALASKVTVLEAELKALKDQ